MLCSKNNRNAVGNFSDTMNKAQELSLIHITIKSKRGDHHGIGLLNVKAIVDKYGGDMVLSFDENEFKAVVIL